MKPYLPLLLILCFLQTLLAQEAHEKNPEENQRFHAKNAASHAFLQNMSPEKPAIFQVPRYRTPTRNAHQISFTEKYFPNPAERPLKEPNSADKDDSLALVDLYYANGGTNWDNNQHWLTGNVKDWYGVTLNKYGRVIALDLSGETNNRFGLAGSLPVAIGTLTALETLNLKFNSLSGPVPDEIGKLTALTYLDLSENFFEGSIPATFGNLSDIVALGLYGNNLSGTLPAALYALTALTAIDLHDNNLTGAVSGQLGNLDNLQLLNLSQNALSGEIPPELGNLGNLTGLGLAENELNGAIPTALGNCTNLQSLDLSKNQLSGEVPSGLNQLDALIQCVLSENRLEELPDLSGMSALSSIYIDANQLNFVDLAHLNLDWTALADYSYAPQLPFPVKADTLADQVTISVEGAAGTDGYYQWFNYDTLISGATSGSYTFPADNPGFYTCEMTNPDFPALTLYSMPFGDIMLGVVRKDYEAMIALYNASNGNNWTRNYNWSEDTTLDAWYGITVEDMRITELHLSGNQLTGTLPAELGNLTALEVLNLGNNQLVGPIPASIGNLTNLKSLFLYDNNLTGIIPPQLGSMQKLQYLYLFNNQLNGSISGRLGELNDLRVLYLSGNRLSGAVPPELGNLQNLGYLYLENNELTALPDLSGLPLLNTCYIGGNQFDFADLQQFAATPANFAYAPQDHISLKRSEGSGEITLSYEGEGITNAFHWFRGDSLINGVAGSQLVVSDTATGAYYCKITSSSFPELTLQSLPESVGNTGLLQGVAKTEYEALVDFYQATNGDLWRKNQNWLSDTVVNAWQGVQTEGIHVSGIMLYNNKVSGQLPEIVAALAPLAHLQLLFLGDNLIEGNIPPDIIQLSRLKSCYLHDNALTGPLPEALGDLSQLQTLALLQNQLTGAVPPALAGLNQLEYLYLEDNAFTALPDLSGLSHLKSWHVQDNALTFEDLEPNMGTGSNAIYAPQAKIGEATYMQLALGQDIKLEVNAAGTDNLYQWHRDGVPIPCAGRDSLLIEDFATEDAGIYTCHITNSTVTELELQTAPFTLSTAPAYTVTINILDGMDPVKGAVVEIHNQTLRSGAEGRVSARLPDGNYPYTVTAPGFKDVADTLSVAGADVSCNVPVRAERYVLGFYVTGRGNPLANARIEIADTTLETNAEGATACRLKNGTHRFGIEATGFGYVAGAVKLNCGPASVNAVLESGHNITFIVTDGDAPIEEAAVTILEKTLTTGSQGKAAITLANGRYAYTVSAAGYETIADSISVQGSTLNEAVRLMATGIEKPLHHQVKPYPVPALSFFMLEARNVHTLKLLNLRGEVVKVKRPRVPLIEVDVSTLKAGMYILQLEMTDGSVLARKLIVQ